MASMLSFASESQEPSAVGRWPFPASCLHDASFWLGAAPATPLASSVLRVSYRDTPFVARPLSPLRRNGWVSRLLSWVFFKERPSIVLPRESTPGCPGSRTCHSPELVPPLPFLTTSTVCSSRDPAGLLHPADDHGVHLVSSRPTTLPPHVRPSSQMHLWPFRAFPSSAGVVPSLHPERCSHRNPFPSRRCPAWQNHAFVDLRGLTRC